MAHNNDWFGAIYNLLHHRIPKHLTIARLFQIAMKRKTRLILALDETDKVKALKVVESVSDVVDAVKINYPIVLSCGLGIVKELSDFSDIICDFKVADIPNTNRLIAEQAFKMGASGLIVHAFVGHDSVEACIRVAKSFGGRDVFVVTEMSHPGGTEFTAKVADELVKVAIDTHATGLIAPATRPDRIAYIRNLAPDLKILSPGVGRQGGSAAGAIKAGADYLIAGRCIYGDNEPRAAAEMLVREIEEAESG